MATTDLTAQRLREVLNYDPNSGLFVRLFGGPGRGNVAGRTAGCLHSKGYTNISVDSVVYKAHRLAWLYVYGRWPQRQIDHVNGDRNDNRISNLRDVTPALNSQNQRSPRINNKSGFLGIAARKDKWCAKLNVDGRSMHLGTFDSAEEAHAAYVAAKRKYHQSCSI